MQTSPLSWQEQLQACITEPAALLNALNLPKALLPQLERGAQLFPLKVSQSYLSRIQTGDVNDPLLKQILPVGQEALTPTGFVSDPLAEQQANPLPGLLHKYRSRVLITLTGACASNCRYCFRRHFAYRDNLPNKQQRQQIIEYIAQDSLIDEVIFSGGDPLLANDKHLQHWISELEQLPQLTTLRLHTRLPIFIPARITTNLLSMLNKTRLQVVMCIHSNHPREISSEVACALQACQQAGLVLLNQSVLLAGINDQASVLAELSRQLFAQGVLPYYLHLLDKVQGAAHFDLPLAKAQAIMQTLQQELPGYLVPRLVREVPGAKHKVLVETHGEKIHASVTTD